MRILFLQSLTYAYIGTMSLSAVLKKNGHEADVFIMNMKRSSKSSLKKILEYDPDIVAFPVFTGWQKRILDVCGLLKNNFDVITVLGGPHPTHCPEIVQHPAVDYICVGEAEVSFLELVNHLAIGKAANRIPGIWLKEAGNIINNGSSVLPNLEELPPMDIGLYCRNGNTIGLQENQSFSVNRGCPYQCTYCNSPSSYAIYGKKMIRSKTPDKAIEEIHYVYDQTPFKSVSFISDNLFLSKEFAREFLSKFKKQVGLPFYCQMRVEMIDVEIVNLLKDAGCHFVTLGIESGSERVRKQILNRSMRDEVIIKACRLLQKAGIGISANNIIGIPGETFEEAWETVSLNTKIRPSVSWCAIFQPYPGSRITRKLQDDGILSSDFYEKVPSTLFDKSILLGNNAHLFVNTQRLFQMAVLFPRWQKILQWFCKCKIPKVYHIVFLYSFYRHVRKAYKMTRCGAIKKILQNAFEAKRA